MKKYQTRLDEKEIANQCMHNLREGVSAISNVDKRG
jgi:hypothetical protein